MVKNPVFNTRSSELCSPRRYATCTAVRVPLQEIIKTEIRTVGPVSTKLSRVRLTTKLGISFKSHPIYFRHSPHQLFSLSINRVAYLEHIWNIFGTVPFSPRMPVGMGRVPSKYHYVRPS